MRNDEIIVVLNDQSFAYDVHSLFQAFYPRVRISVLTDDRGADFLRNEIPDWLVSVNGDEISLADREKIAADREGTERYQDLYRRGTTQYQDLYRGADGEEPLARSDRAEIKNRLKLAVYDALCAKEGRTLPWGTLTGIRPTKLAMRKLEEGASEEEAASFMESVYRTGKDKRDLAVMIAKREKKILNTIPVAEGYSLYIGIPFCPTICMYCSFSSYPIAAYRDVVEDYLTALFYELDAVAEMFAGRKLCSVYVGGGTPTALSADQLERFLDKIETAFNLSYVYEFTVESGRPDSINTDKLQVIKTHFNGNIRISINPQTMNDDTLKRIGRHHSAEDIRQAFALARETGIATINMDMIVGLPGENVAAVEHTLSEIMKLSPDNLTVHALAIKRSSRLHEMLLSETAKKGALLTEGMSYDDYLSLHAQQIMASVYDSAAQMGMAPYYMYRQKNIAGNLENVGFAPEGKEGIYNILIMEEKQDIVAVGAGAACKCLVRDENGVPLTKAKIRRCENVKNVEAYIGRIDEMIDRKRKLYGEGKA